MSHYYWPLPENAGQDDNLTASALRVFAFINSFWATTGEAFPSVDYAARRTHLDRRTVQRALRLLEKLRYVSPIKRHNQTTLYEPGERFFTQKRMAASLPPRGTHAALVDQRPALKLPPRSDEFWDDNDLLKPRPREPQ